MKKTQKMKVEAACWDASAKDSQGMPLQFIEDNTVVSCAYNKKSFDPYSILYVENDEECEKAFGKIIMIQAAHNDYGPTIGQKNKIVLCCRTKEMEKKINDAKLELELYQYSDEAFEFHPDYSKCFENDYLTKWGE